MVVIEKRYFLGALSALQSYLVLTLTFIPLYYHALQISFDDVASCANNPMRVYEFLSDSTSTLADSGGKREGEGASSSIWNDYTNT